MGIFRKSKIKILVTGAKGQLGSYLVDQLNKMATLSDSFIGSAYGIDKDDLDITDRSAVMGFFNNHGAGMPAKIDCVVHCAATTDTAAIENDPYGPSYDVNVIGTRNIAQACALNKIKLVFISTDYVLSEKSELVVLDYMPYPVNAYGTQKLLAEKEVETTYRDWPSGFMILRPSWMYGNSTKSFFEKLLSRIARGCADFDFSRTAIVNEMSKNEYCHRVVDDAFGRPTPVRTVFETLVQTLKHSHTHNSEIDVVDAQPAIMQISRYAWAKIIVEEFTAALRDENCSNGADSDACRVMSKTVVTPCKQSDFSGMQHPGLIGSGQYRALGYTRRIGFDQDTYSIITTELLPTDKSVELVRVISREYIERNLNRLVELVNSEYRKETEMLNNVGGKQN